MFQYKYKVPKSELKTTYGSICVENVVFDPVEIEKELPSIVFEDENLKHMFAESALNKIKRKNIYRRFAPKTEITTKQDEIQSLLNYLRRMYILIGV